MKNKLLITVCSMLTLTVFFSLCGCGTGSTPKKNKTKNEVVDKEYHLIENNTYEENIQPLGTVTFATYNPNGKIENGDVIFQIEKDGKVLQALEGMESNNVRKNMAFDEVTNVFFLDYNKDKNDDIFVICNYLDSNNKKYSECRI